MTGCGGYSGTMAFRGQSTVRESGAAQGGNELIHGRDSILCIRPEDLNET